MVITSNGFKKIEPLINDIKVSRIDCFGANKPIGVVNAGRKMKTKIALTDVEIKNVFETYANMANIPLMDGVVKMNVGQMTFEGMNSNTQKFSIKKNTAYSMLEGGRKRRGKIRRAPVRRL